MNNSKIEWTDFTWNPFVGCSRVSPGCDHCYAERMAWRLANNPKLPPETREKYQHVVQDGKWTGEIEFFQERLHQPLRSKNPRRIFVGSMGDLFHPDVPFSFIHEVWEIMKSTPQHIFLVLTKRPERMRDVLRRIYCPQRMGWAHGFWNHIWLGVTVENQAQADARIPVLLEVPAAKRYVSIEPMLGQVDLTRVKWAKIDVDPDDYKSFGVPAPDEMWSLNNVLHARPADQFNPKKIGLDWVIVGGETGPGAQPMHPDWVRKIKDDCQTSGVPFFFKSWGEWAQSKYASHGKYNLALAGKFQVSHVFSSTDPAQIGKDRYYPIPLNYDGSVIGIYPMERVGKARAGRFLDGREWREWPASLA